MKLVSYNISIDRRKIKKYYRNIIFDKRIPFYMLNYIPNELLGSGGNLSTKKNKLRKYISLIFKKIDYDPFLYTKMHTRCLVIKSFLSWNYILSLDPIWIEEK